MKPISNMFLCASFSVAMLAMGCAGTHTSGSDRHGTTDSPSSTSPSSPTSTSSPNTKSSSTPTSASRDNVSAIPNRPSRESFDMQRDTLDACLARIPSNSSDSQRMLATLTCERDAQQRKSLDSVPGK